MEYVIPIVLVVLVVGGFIAFLVLNAADKGGAAAEGGSTPPGIGPDEHTPLGDTTEHGSEHQAEERRFSRPAQSSSDPDEAAHVARPGEGEGSEALEFEGRQPRR